ncbi:MAG: hypothetical protein GSR84_01455 [Desulfurococcales archaeon]|nr:hypothetical protein [Desulfurococcales archaeon]
MITNSGQTTKKLLLIFVTIIPIIIAIVSHAQLTLNIDHGDYTIHNGKIIIVNTKNNIIQIQQNDIYTGGNNTAYINITLPLDILDVKIYNNTIQTLTYTKILDRRIIILYKVDTYALKIIEKNVIDITNITNEDVIAGNIINNTILLITKHNIIQLNKYNNTILNNITINVQYSQSYIDETQDKLYIIYTLDNKTLLLIVDGNNISKGIIDGTVIDIDDNKNYIADILGNKTVILDGDKKVAEINGITSSICTSDNTVYYGKLYSNGTVLSSMHLGNGTQYILSIYPGSIVDIACTSDYIAVVFDNYTISIELIRDLMKNAVQLTPETGSPVTSAPTSGEGTGARSDSATDTNVDTGIAEGEEDTYVIMLKISSIILLAVVILLTVYIVKGGRRYG